MASVELKGKITYVFPVEFVGENKTAKQDFVLNIPGYVDGFGDKKGIDEMWKISVMGESVSKIGLAPASVGKKAKVKVYLNSKMLPGRKKGDPDFYIINVILAAIELLP